MECKYEQRYDDVTHMMYLNNEPSVMHCHHYTTLFIRVALEFERLGGVDNLVRAAEDSFYLVFRKYFIYENIKDIKVKIDIIEQLYSLTGMGIIGFSDLDKSGGKVDLRHSHVDEGWLKKFGKSDRPINFMTQGYIQAAFSICNNLPIHAYQATETKSIAMGDEQSRFKVLKKERI